MKRFLSRCFPIVRICIFIQRMETQIREYVIEIEEEEDAGLITEIHRDDTEKHRGNMS